MAEPNQKHPSSKSAQNNAAEVSPDQQHSRRDRLTLILVDIGVVLIVLAAAYLFVDRYVTPRLSSTPQAVAVDFPSQPVTQANPKDNNAPVDLAPLSGMDSSQEGIRRATFIDTRIPTRPRVDVITYTVKNGESLFSIAKDFNLKPETLLWGNFDTLQDNPHLLQTGQVLNILPENGTYYKWSSNDNLNNVAAFFKVDPQVIIDYPGNRIDLTEVTSKTFGIQDGAWLIIPGGKRAIKDWGPPAISRTNPAAARYYGPGSCGTIYTGAVGNGSFVWPTVNHSISGYSYDSNVHPGVDFGGPAGNSVFATDAGVVVYAGWSNFGYGNLIVIDHGNGWQSAYAHLSGVGVSCGMSVFQGGAIGAVGTTGNSSGPHLHFELVYNGAKLNPMDYLH